MTSSRSATTTKRLGARLEYTVRFVRKLYYFGAAIRHNNLPVRTDIVVGYCSVRSFVHSLSVPPFWRLWTLAQQNTPHSLGVSTATIRLYVKWTYFLVKQNNQLHQFRKHHSTPLQLLNSERILCFKRRHEVYKNVIILNYLDNLTVMALFHL